MLRIMLQKNREIFFARLRGQNYFVKLLGSYLTLIVFCVSAMGIVSYDILSNSIQKSLIEENDRVLYQLNNTIDTLVFSKTNDLSFSMQQDTFSNSAISYYFTEDMNQNIYGMSSVMDYCNTIRGLNPLVLSAGIYFEKNQLYICSEGVEAPGYGSRAEGNLLQKCRKLLDFSEKSNYWCEMDQPNTVAEDGKTTKQSHIIYFIRRIERLGGNGGAIILALDENTIYQSIRQASPDSLDSILICDESGTVISYYNKALIGKNLSELSSRLTELNQKNNLKIPINGVPVLCSFLPSASTGWKYVTFTSMQVINQAGERLTRAILIVALCTLGIGALLSLVPTSLLSAPVRALEALCNRMGRRRKVGTGTVLSLNMISEEITLQMTRMKEMTPLVQDMLLSDLLFLPACNMQEMQDRMRLIEFEFVLPRFSVVAVQSEKAVFEKEIAEWEEDIGKLAGERYGQNHILLFNIRRENTFFILLNFDLTDTDVKDLIHHCEMQTSGNTQIGIGTTVESMKYLHTSCEQAEYALSYFFLFPEHRILSARECKSIELGSQEIEKELLNHLEEGLSELNRAKTLECFRQIEHLLLSEKISLADAQKVIQRCCTVLRDAAQRSALENWAAAQNSANAARDVVEFSEIYRGMIGDFFETVELRRIAANYQQVSRAEQYIQENICDRNLSLQQVADFLHISPSYLSKIFKAETGTTFIDYVIGWKLKECEDLLLNSSMRIEEISEAMGYSTPQYFISRFKIAYGVTPKQYRSNVVPNLLREDHNRS